ncbi:Fic family protein [Clostridioides sp. ES-S-0190-01]|uniref:Fic family protein n=1 Tax=Clostridioides sp. ES-S-0190-01 TaxID=2770787 RepID=UPI001D113ED8|nr:Fic family protein [Clostridioides sp. ES-S-0190-01]
MNKSYIPKYIYKFPTNLPHGDKKYTLTYIRRMISEFVYDMGNLENNPFTFPEVQTLLDGITVGGHKLSDQNQILNIKSSWDYVIKLSNKENLSLNKDTICSIHKIVARDEALIVGDFRNGNIGIAGTTQYECIEVTLLNDLFVSDINIINKITNPLEKAIIINLWLSYCQFFYDGNKRTARLTSNLILINNDIGVLSIPAKHKQEYNTLMLNFYETLEADEVIKFLLEKCITFFDGYNYKSYKELFKNGN